MTSLAEWLAQARQRLSHTADQPALEAQVLLAHVLQKPRPWVIAHSDQTLEADQINLLETSLCALQAGFPLPYLTGRQEFFDLDFAVSPQVLIPRPETELLVEKALAWLRAHPARRRAADVGTGSGCIAVTLAHHITDLSLLAVDRSATALNIARRNAQRWQVSERIHWLQSDLLSAVSARVDLLCANLPYIPTHKLADLRVAQHEPRLALDGGADGLDLIHTLLTQAARCLAPAALILLEIEAEQPESALSLARRCFPLAQSAVHTDLAGLPRLLSIQT